MAKQTEIKLHCPRCTQLAKFSVRGKADLLHYQYECDLCNTMLRVEQVNDKYVAMFVAQNYTGCANGNCEE